MLRFLHVAFGLLTLALLILTVNAQAFGASESVLWSFGNGTDGAILGNKLASECGSVWCLACGSGTTMAPKGHQSASGLPKAADRARLRHRSKWRLAALGVGNALFKMRGGKSARKKFCAGLPVPLVVSNQPRDSGDEDCAQLAIPR